MVAVTIRHDPRYLSESEAEILECKLAECLDGLYESVTVRAQVGVLEETHGDIRTIVEVVGVPDDEDPQHRDSVYSDAISAALGSDRVGEFLVLTVPQHVLTS